MKSTFPCAALALSMLAGLSFAVQAQSQPTVPRIEPGLWELSIALKSQNGAVEAAVRQAQEQIKLLPPDQRKQIEDIMAARGVRLGDQVSTMQICISKEDAERGQVPQQAGDCTQQVVERNGSQVKVKFSCATTPPASGEATVNFLGTKAYTSTGVLDTVVAGAAQRVNVDQNGRWLATECGSVKPLGQ